MGKIQRPLFLAAALLAASAAPAFAQQPPAVRAGEEVIVTQSTSGQELRGRLVELSPTTMAILVDGRRIDLPIENVLRIDARTDSVKNGAIIGAAIFGGLGLLACPSGQGDLNCGTAIAINTLFGALAGMGIDALLKGRTPIYVKAGRSTASLQFKLRF
jgi:hypothetical protein